MGEDEKWSTRERQKDEGESKTAWTGDGELKRKPGRRQDGGQTESSRPGVRHLRSITRPVRDTPNKAPAELRIPMLLHHSHPLGAGRGSGSRKILHFPSSPC